MTLWTTLAVQKCRPAATGPLNRAPTFADSASAGASEVVPRLTVAVGVGTGAASGVGV